MTKQEDKKTEQTAETTAADTPPRGTVALKDVAGPGGGAALAKAAKEAAEDQGVVPKKDDEYVKTKMAKKKKKDEGKLDIMKMSVEELTEFFNDMIPTAIDLGLKHYDVRKDVFMTQDMGRRAVQRLHNIIQKTKEDKLKPAKEKTVKKSATKKTSKKSAKKSDRAKRVTLDEASKITWKGKDNPFREGTGRWKRTELVRTSSGKTVKTYLTNKGRAGTLAYCVRNGLASVS